MVDLGINIFYLIVPFLIAMALSLYFGILITSRLFKQKFSTLWVALNIGINTILYFVIARILIASGPVVASELLLSYVVCSCFVQRILLGAALRSSAENPPPIKSRRHWYIWKMSIVVTLSYLITMLIMGFGLSILFTAFAVHH